jgi:hypothetical protein
VISFVVFLRTIRSIEATPVLVSRLSLSICTGARALLVGLALERRIVVDRNPARMDRRRDPLGPLLHDVRQLVADQRLSDDAGSADRAAGDPDRMACTACSPPMACDSVRLPGCGVRRSRDGSLSVRFPAAGSC